MKKRIGIVIEDSDATEFVTYDSPTIDWENEAHREDAVPEFKEKIEPWLENASIIVSLDIDSEVLVSTEKEEVPATVYFEGIWARE